MKPRAAIALCCLVASCTTAAVEEPCLAIYSVKDLVFPPADGVAAFMQLEHLTTNLRQATGSDYWQPPHSIVSEDSGLVAVTASPRMQELVENVLDDLRRFERARR